MSRRYTKADLEEIVYSQLENLDAMHDLLRIMKVQNELLDNANKKLRQEISKGATGGTNHDGKFDDIDC